MGKLLVETGPLRGRIFSLPDRGTVILGRDEGCPIQLPDVMASRRHCAIGRTEGGYVVRDLGSRNGTSVNGENLTTEGEGESPRRTWVLRAGDTIQVGHTLLSFLDDVRDPLLGKIVGGYRIEQRLGAGGMGTVYRALQISLKRSVALKILSRTLAADQDFVRRFLREARFAAKLIHPNVAKIYGFGQDQGLYYYSMEYMAGGSLQQFIDRAGRVSPSLALSMVLDATRALVWAEENDIVHRDIKPDNLLLESNDGTGTVKVGDFGISKDRRGSQTSLQTGRIVGTPHYMAPEQALGRPVDHRADIYSLGCTLYCALSGEPPYGGKTTMEILLKKVKEPPRSLRKALPEVPAAVAALTHKMMAQDPKDRYQTASELHDALTALRADLDTGTRPSLPAEGVRSSRNRVLPFVAAACVIVIAGILVFLALRNGDGAREEGALQPALAPSKKTVEPKGKAAEGKADPAGKTPPAKKVEVVSPVPPDPSSLLPQLQSLEAEWREGRLEAEDALARLKSLGEGFPQGSLPSEFQVLEMTLRLDLERSGRRALAGLVEGNLKALLEERRYREARELLGSFLEEHPFAAEAVRERIAAVKKQAQAELDAALESARAAMAKGLFDDARARVAAVTPLLPPELEAEGQAAAAEVESAHEAFRKASEMIDEATTAVRDACRALDFSSASQSLSNLSGSFPPAVEARRAYLHADLDLLRGVGEQLARRLKTLVEGGAAFPIGLWLAAPDETPRECQLRGFSGSALRLECGSPPDGEERSLWSLDDATLKRMLKPAEGEQLTPREIEGLGLLLLYGGGPERAWSMLTDPLVEESRRRAYQERLVPEAGAELEKRIVEIHAELPSLRAGTPEAERTEAALRNLLRVSGWSPELEGLRAQLALLYIEHQRRILARRRPSCLFSVEPKEYSPGGSVKLVYDFATSSQLSDFHQVGGGDGRMRLRQKGLVSVRGQWRLFHGNPFRNRLRVSGSVPDGGYKELAPDIGVVLWTRDRWNGDVFPVRPEYSSGPVETVIPPAIALVVGYTDPVEMYLVREGNRLVLPASVVFFGARSEGTSFRIKTLGPLWGEKPRRGFRGAVHIDIESGPGDRVRWQLNRQSAIGGRVGEYVGGTPLAGSVTLFTRGSEVLYHTLEVEGDLDPLWEEEEISRRAVASLDAVDPSLTQVAFNLPEEKMLIRDSGSRSADRRLLYDSFDGKFHLDWEIVRPEPTHHSLTKHPGALTITTRRGSLGGERNSCRNLFLVRNPVEKGGDFDIITRLIGFRPQDRYNQAGFVCYNDDDNFLKAVYEKGSESLRFVLGRETGGKGQYMHHYIGFYPETLWMRLRKRGSVYSLAISTQGVSFRTVGEVGWGDGAPKMLGLHVNNGPRDAPEIDAVIDFFEVLKLPPQTAE